MVIVKVFIAASLILVLSVFGLLLREPPPGFRFLIPENFTGTVYVHFRVPGAETLKEENGYKLIVVPTNGVVNTSFDSELIGGKPHNEYWLYSEDGKRYPMPLDKLVFFGGWTEGQEVIIKFRVKGKPDSCETSD